MQTAVVGSTIWAPASAPHVGARGVTLPAGEDTQQVVFSDPLPVDLYVYRGDSGRFRVAVTDPAGNPLDISTATWDCDIRQSPDAADPLVSLDVNPVDANTIEVVLTPLMSALLVDNAVWDLEMTLDAEVQTLMAGAVHVHKDVSRP